MDAARAAARRVVGRLGEVDAVNVIIFDDKAESLYRAPKRLDAAVRREVDTYLDKMQTRGGTDIGGALGRALDSQTKDARPDIVFFLTDGQSDGPTAIAAAGKGDPETRVFTVGIGEGVDKALLARIAAMNFAMEHDDGQSTRDLAKAQVILVAPSRCGKTPTMLYLALQHGIFATNFPITEDDLEQQKLPKSLEGLADLVGTMRRVRGARTSTWTMFRRVQTALASSRGLCSRGFGLIRLHAGTRRTHGGCAVSCSGASAARG
jgi:hypothetical protein